MLYIPFLQPLVDWLTNIVVRFAQWLNGIELPFGLDPIWMFSGLLVFGGFVFPFIVALFYMSWKEQQRASLLTEMERDLGWERKPACGLRQTSVILRSLNAEGSGHLKNLINAYLLRMVYDGRLQPVMSNTQEGHVQALSIGKRKQESLPLHPDDAETEQIFFQMLKEAAGSDNVFQPQELTDYMKTHKREMKMFVARFREKMNKAQLQARREEVRKVLAFRKFLKEFTVSNERRAYEVQLWRDYLVYATLFGFGEQVRADMHEMNPDFFQLDSRVANINLAYEMSAFESDLSSYALEVQTFDPLSWLVEKVGQLFRK